MQSLTSVTKAVKSYSRSYRWRRGDSMRPKLAGRSFWLGFAAGMLSVVLCAFTILLAGHLYSRRAMSAVQLPPPPIRSGSTDLPDLVMKDLDGQELALTDFRGRIVFLNFGAPWCIPCILEMPGINKLHSIFGTRIAFLS